jgi:hypothetical protein
MAKLKNADHYEKYKDPRWQKKRLEILERDNFTCVICCEKEKTLHVHHRKYLNKITKQGIFWEDPWNYPDELLVTLCEECHEIETENMKIVLHDLGEMLKEIFFAHEIKDIAIGFYSMDTGGDMVASAIRYLLSSPDKMAQLMKDYFDYCKELNKKKKNG